MVSERTDQRRETGQRTREGLLAATLEVLAQRGPEGVSLREITNSAGANVSAVSYHFGSLKALCDEAIERAMEQYLDAQLDAVASLGAGSSVEELAAAFARPMVRALSAGGQELTVMRTVARVGIDPPQGWGRLDGKFHRVRQGVVRVLAGNLRGIGEQELLFRTRCAAGLLNWLALAPIGAELAARPVEEIERWLTPVVAGTLIGTDMRPDQG
jgi:AcrR family transcriptional regulator